MSKIEVKVDLDDLLVLKADASYKKEYMDFREKVKSLLNLEDKIICDLELFELLKKEIKR